MDHSYESSQGEKPNRKLFVQRSSMEGFRLANLRPKIQRGDDAIPASLFRKAIITFPSKTDFPISQASCSFSYPADDGIAG